MTIGTVVPQVMAECGIDHPSADIASPDFQMRQLAELMNAAGRDINTCAEWSGAMRSIQLVASDATPLPEDFQELAEAGAVELKGGGYQPARPLTDPTLWQLLRAKPGKQVYYHLTGGELQFSKPIEGGTMRYVSCNWLVGKCRIQSDDDVPIFPEELLARGTIWRWKRQKGLPYEDLLAEFEADLNAAIRADRGAK